MQSKTGIPSPEEHAKAMLRMRGEIAGFLEEARDSGNRREARKWQAELRKFDKLIADYGLNRYA